MPTCALTAVPPMYLTERQLITHKTHIVIIFLIGVWLCFLYISGYRIVHVTRHPLVLHIIWCMQKSPPPLRKLTRYLQFVAVKVSFSRLFFMTQVTAASADMLMDRILVML